MKSPSAVTVHFEYADVTTKYPDGTVLESKLVQHISLGNRADLMRKTLGFIPLNAYDDTRVTLPEPRAERLKWFYDQFYEERGGRKFENGTLFRTDCHSFINFLGEYTDQVEILADTPVLTHDTGLSVPPNELARGGLYGIYNVASELDTPSNIHSFLALDDPTANLSVIGANGNFTVATTPALMATYAPFGAHRISPIYGQGLPVANIKPLSAEDISYKIAPRTEKYTFSSAE